MQIQNGSCLQKLIVELGTDYDSAIKVFYFKKKILSHFSLHVKIVCSFKMSLVLSGVVANRILSTVPVLVCRLFYFTIT